jgi:Xaa-Pro aminopeptidase
MTAPLNRPGYLLDAYARRPLWEDGLDYRHGTGHGVGHFLNVHEGPAGIGTRKAYDEYSVKEGYYEDGKFGSESTLFLSPRPISLSADYSISCTCI